MKVVLIILVFLHGLVHLLGFVKSSGIKDLKELTLPISKLMGLLWLFAAILLFAYGILHALTRNYAWAFGLAGVILSQVLVFLFWKDARFGTIPNVLILAVTLSSLGYYCFQQRIREETSRLLGNNAIVKNGILSDSDIVALPTPVQHWLRNSGAVGKPLIHSGKVLQTAEMQLKPGQNAWLSASAIQYTTIDRPAFIWSVDVKMNSLLSFRGRDKFEEGEGEMLIKLNSLFNIVNARGEKINEGSLQRYLGEMVWFPCLALSPYIYWEAINDTTAKATMTYLGSSGSGTFHFNSRGDITRFSALRYKGGEADAQRIPWEMNISEYQSFDGIRVPSKMTSTWKLKEADWTWLKLEVNGIRYSWR